MLEDTSPPLFLGGFYLPPLLCFFRWPTQELATALTEGPPLLAGERKPPLFLKLGTYKASITPSHDLKWFLTSGAAYSEEGLRRMEL